MNLPVLLDNPGIIVYKGPSVFDGEQIVAIATGFKRSRNPKTGKAIQIWIIRADIAPHEALQTGDDFSVCFHCKHAKFGSCYVNLGMGPWNIYQAYLEGKYKMATKRSLEYFRGKTVRLGAYGDPGAVPVDIWDSICGVAKSWLGYTHAWRYKLALPVKKYCMASCDTEKEAMEAISRGWKPFYVRSENDAIPAGFFSCPASAEAGKRLTCEDCGVCKGGEHREGQGAVTLLRHGPSFKKVFFERGIKAMKQKKAYRYVAA
tara:strand:- start:269 stop:1051 length:783 start_codon:yes stop_codon:yes gene_type:complete